MNEEARLAQIARDMRYNAADKMSPSEAIDELAKASANYEDLLHAENPPTDPEVLRLALVRLQYAFATVAKSGGSLAVAIIDPLMEDLQGWKK